MNSIRALKKIVSLHPPGSKSRFWLVIRCLSQWLVLAPSRLCVVGEIPDTLLPQLLKRIEWFYLSMDSGAVTIKRSSGWVLYQIQRGRLSEPQSVGAFTAVFQAMIGKILVHEYSEDWLKWEWTCSHKVFVVNWTREYRMSAWRFAASVARRPLAAFGAGEERRDERPRTAEVVVVGNGPSAYRVFDRRFDGMDVIVCNTAIKSKRLLAERNVVALGFIDAAFFVGPSAYCEAFYGALNEAIRLRDFAVYVDQEHEACVQQRTPSLRRDRLFPVVLKYELPVRPNFKEGRAQRPGNSVFTSLLLPLAATYYRTIHLVGFDGKDPNMKNYFWKHSEEFQFNDLLPTVKESDPGFFAKRDYDEYNRRNAEEVEEYISAIEKTGVRVIMTHPSFIEPLQRRYVANSPTSLVA